MTTNNSPRSLASTLTTLLLFFALAAALVFAAYSYGYQRGQQDLHSVTTFQANPETDAEAEALLLGDDPTVSNLAMVGIYRIYRKRDKMGVGEAYLATLTHVVELQETE